MTVSQLLAAIQRELDTARDLNVPPAQRRHAADVLTYRVVIWSKSGGPEVDAVRVDHDQRILWLETS